MICDQAVILLWCFDHFPLGQHIYFRYCTFLFQADQPDVPSNAKSVNRAVFMRGGAGASSATVSNSTINVGKGIRLLSTVHII